MDTEAPPPRSRALHVAYGVVSLVSVGLGLWVSNRLGWDGEALQIGFTSTICSLVGMLALVAPFELRERRRP